MALIGPAISYSLPRKTLTSSIRISSFEGEWAARLTQQVYALVRSGELPAIKLGGRGVWRVDRHKLDDYLEQLEADTREWTKTHPLNPRVKHSPR